MSQIGRTPLYLAAACNSAAVAELLIRSGADIDITDRVSRALIPMANSPIVFAAGGTTAGHNCVRLIP